MNSEGVLQGGDFDAANRDYEHDDQAGAEIFDETHLDDEGAGDLYPDEAERVLDVTRAAGNADERLSEGGRPEASFGAWRIEAEADALLGLGGDRLNSAERPGDGAVASDEIELVYSGLMEDVRGAQASAAHWEARRLSDDDIAALGYGPDEI